MHSLAHISCPLKLSEPALVGLRTLLPYGLGFRPAWHSSVNLHDKLVYRPLGRIANPPNVVLKESPLESNS